jgi:hypothetical protein
LGYPNSTWDINQYVISIETSNCEDGDRIAGFVRGDYIVYRLNILHLQPHLGWRRGGIQMIKPQHFIEPPPSSCIDKFYIVQLRMGISIAR